jgi:hypothetical protein
MMTKIKLVALAAMVILGCWLAFEQGGPEPKMVSAWSCAGSKALFCVQR